MESQVLTHDRVDDDELELIYNTLNIPINELSNFTSWLSRQENPRLSNKAISELIQATSIEDPEKIRNAISGILLLLSYATDEGSFKRFITDFLDLYKETISGIPDLANKIAEIDKISDKYSLYYKQFRAQREGCARIVSSSFTVAFKPVLDKVFDSDKGSIDSFNPQFLGLVPVVLARINDSSGNSISVQLSPEDIDSLLEELLASKIVISKYNERNG